MASTMLDSDTSIAMSSRFSRQVDGALVNLRWAVILLAVVAVILLNGTIIPNQFFLSWVVIYVVFNALLWIGVHWKKPPLRLPVISLIGDLLFLAILPLLPGSTYPTLILFSIFPTLVGAMRFGIPTGILVALIALLPYEIRAALILLPDWMSSFIPIARDPEMNLFAALLPILALLGAVVLVGYIAQREREAAVGTAAIELEELRKAIASARLFYESTDALSNTLNYNQILDVMLQAGVSGMPRGRSDGATAVGIALLFADDPEHPGEKMLRVTTHRQLNRGDTELRIPGKEGIVARAIETGEAVPSTKIANDPELSIFASLRRCRAGVCYPLQSGLDVYGAVVLASTTTQMPSEQHMRLLRAFINQAAVAFQNAQLYQNLRRERDHIIEAEASARSKLARDLHDGPTQSMAALAMRLDFIRILLEREPDKAKQELEQAREAVMRVGKELRGLLFTLRPLSLETQGLSAALAQYGQRLRENENIPVDVQPGHLGADLDPNVAATVFGVIEEAVNNARKHAQGTPIHISLNAHNGALIATVRDEGPGFDVNAVNNNYNERGSLGMVNMRDRARLIDGQLSIDSAPGRGTRVTLLVPLHDGQLKTGDGGRK